MWECGKCGRRFVNPNQWHSCGNAELDEILDAAGPSAVSVYRAVERELSEAGTFRIHPQKTRIAFISRMTFASVRLAERWVDLSLILPSALDDERIRRIDVYGPTTFDHHLRVHGPAEVDQPVGKWLRAALRRGDQDTLDPAAIVEPLTTRQLAKVTVPLRSEVVDHGDRLGLRLPRYAAQALALAPEVMARVGGESVSGTVVSTATGGVLFIEVDAGALGLVVGDPIDVYLSARS